jgi:hypothetical protein
MCGNPLLFTPVSPAKLAADLPVLWALIQERAYEVQAWTSPVFAVEPEDAKIPDLKAFLGVWMGCGEDGAVLIAVHNTVCGWPDEADAPINLFHDSLVGSSLYLLGNKEVTFEDLFDVPQNW